MRPLASAQNDFRPPPPRKKARRIEHQEVGVSDWFCASSSKRVSSASRSSPSSSALAIASMVCRCAVTQRSKVTSPRTFRSGTNWASRRTKRSSRSSHSSPEIRCLAGCAKRLLASSRARVSRAAGSPAMFSARPPAAQRERNRASKRGAPCNVYLWEPEPQQRMRQQRGKVRSRHLARGAGDGEPRQNPNWARTQGLPGGIVGNDASGASPRPPGVRGCDPE